MAVAVTQYHDEKKTHHDSDLLDPANDFVIL